MEELLLKSKSSSGSSSSASCGAAGELLVDDAATAASASQTQKHATSGFKVFDTATRATSSQTDRASNVKEPRLENVGLVWSALPLYGTSPLAWSEFLNEKGVGFSALSIAVKSTDVVF
ncbi:unnamed protein product, partial [Amoebophrya sp. A25]|eukprot:GSA25T00018252001.1